MMKVELQVKSTLKVKEGREKSKRESTLNRGLKVTFWEKAGLTHDDSGPERRTK
jgi:hypothetical protein